MEGLLLSDYSDLCNCGSWCCIGQNTAADRNVVFYTIP